MAARRLGGAAAAGRAFRTPIDGLAAYDAWATRRLFDSMRPVRDEDYRRDVGLVFGSLHSTLSHVWLGSELWLSRMTGSDGPLRLPRSPPVTLARAASFWNPEPDAEGRVDPCRFGEAVADREELLEALLDVDERWAEFVASLGPDGWSAPFTYRNTRGEEHTKSVGPCVQHVFNHATHHRGQASAAVTQLLGPDAAPSMDMIYYFDDNA
jgi:uncharacterized damage-inducible protein DinB